MGAANHMRANESRSRGRDLLRQVLPPDSDKWTCRTALPLLVGPPRLAYGLGGQGKSFCPRSGAAFHAWQWETVGGRCWPHLPLSLRTRPEPRPNLVHHDSHYDSPPRLTAYLSKPVPVVSRCNSSPSTMTLSPQVTLHLSISSLRGRPEMHRASSRKSPSLDLSPLPLSSPCPVHLCIRILHSPQRYLSTCRNQDRSIPPTHVFHHLTRDKLFETLISDSPAGLCVQKSQLILSHLPLQMPLNFPGFRKMPSTY